MCRSIHPLFNFEPPASAGEIQDAALQFVRKVSGFREPSAANRRCFDEAVAEIAHACEHLLAGLTTRAAPKDRGEEALRRRRAFERSRAGRAGP